MSRLRATRAVDNRTWLTIVLLGGLVWSVLQVQWTDGVIHKGGLRAIVEIGRSAISPAIDGGILRLAATEAWTTVAYAVAGLTVALVIGFPIGVLASGAISQGVGARAMNVGVARFVLAFFRSVHELVWAWLFIAALGLSPMVAVLAIGIPYGGILGRVYAELLLDVPPAPLQALRSAGASPWRVFLYGRLPMALPDILSYTFYRFECGIRTAAIMSFVGLGGLGHQIQISLLDLDYQRAWTFIFVLIGLVILVDVWSSVVRQRTAS